MEQKDQDQDQSMQNAVPYGQIMDIQPPGGPEQKVSFPDDSNKENPSNEGAEPTPPPQIANQPQSETADSQIPTMPAGLEEPDNQNPPVANANNANNQEPANKKPPKKPGNKFPLIAVTLAVVIMVGLAAAAVMLYLQQDQAQAPGTNNSTEKNEVEKVTPATEEDVDNSIKQIDDELNQLDDKEDFSQDQLSDDKLGL